MRRQLLLLGALLLPFLYLQSPAPVSAEGISGAVEPSYSVSREKSEDSSGVETDTESKTFTQRYFLNLDRTLYPNLRFSAGGTFEKIKTTSTTDGAEEESTLTTTGGFLRLGLDTRIISSSIGFTRREERATSSIGSTTPSLLDTYSANLSWRPEGLPSASALFSRTNTYDKDRELEDRVSDFLSLTLRHAPVKNLDLQGRTSFTDTRDKLADIESKLTSYSGRATYTRRFGDRVSTTASYDYFRQETETIIKGEGKVLSQVFPFSGLSTIDNTPTLDTLEPNPNLVDGDMTASSGINIGPVGVGGDNRLRQIGLDFINPSRVNTIYVWVDRDLPANVSDAFSWDVYISSDNENWTLWQTVPSAPFGDFFNRFEIDINNVSARYLKVVTSPLPPGVLPPPGFDVTSIIVTEMQTFLRAPVEDTQSKRTQTSHIYDLSARWLILDRPNLYYNFYYWGSQFDPGGISRYVVTNSLNLTHTFSRVFSGSARIGREDSKDTDRRSANLYSASLTAVPLPTLFHRLVLSGRFSKTGEGSRNSHSITLNNTAELYQGLNINLIGGMSISTSETDRKTFSTFITSGASVVPHRRLGINVNYRQTNTKQSGGGLGEDSTNTSSGEIGVSYLPFNNLSIFASYGETAATGRDTTNTQNYAVSWSPFEGGDLLFNLTYYESIDSEGTKDRTISPSLIWYLRRNATLETSYQFRKSTSPALNSEANIWYSRLRISL